MLIYANKNS
ncbi:unnamed protein product [Callosobruchus maculatus]|uniref:Uncharacterized protein n=1 Tax=Callosobruchus maculatus TaxID=64391 RepID=A0A653BKJ0_CALMS|nr:unnamed protein product [Callosobruchus maculatus]